MENQEYSTNSNNNYITKDIKKSKNVMFFLFGIILLIFILCLLFVNWGSKKYVKNCDYCNQEINVSSVDKFLDTTMSIDQCHAISLVSLAIVDLYDSLYWDSEKIQTIYILKKFVINNWQNLGEIYGNKIMYLIKIIESVNNLSYLNSSIIALRLKSLANEIVEYNIIKKNFFSLFVFAKKEKNYQNIKLKNELIKISNEIKTHNLSLFDIYKKLKNNSNFINLDSFLMDNLESTIKLKQAFKDVINTMHKKFSSCTIFQKNLSTIE